MGVRIVVFGIGVKILGSQRLLPVEGLLRICLNPFSVPVHIRELFCRFHTGILVLCGALDQLQGFFVICLHINSV